MVLATCVIVFWTIDHQHSTINYSENCHRLRPRGIPIQGKDQRAAAKPGPPVTGFGTHSEELVDYPRFIRPVAEAVARGEFERGVVLGGSGHGGAIVANRVQGVRCALCWNVESARLGRLHNNANVISIGERMVSLETALKIVHDWLDTPFAGGRHQQRMDMIDAAKL